MRQVTLLSASCPSDLLTFPAPSCWAERRPDILWKIEGRFLFFFSDRVDGESLMFHRRALCSWPFDEYVWIQLGDLLAPTFLSPSKKNISRLHIRGKTNKKGSGRRWLQQKRRDESKSFSVVNQSRSASSRTNDRSVQSWAAQTEGKKGFFFPLSFKSD